MTFHVLQTRGMVDISYYKWEVSKVKGTLILIIQLIYSINKFN